MIGCLTETTTCVVAKPLVEIKTLWVFCLGLEYIRIAYYIDVLKMDGN